MTSKNYFTQKETHYWINCQFLSRLINAHHCQTPNGENISITVWSESFFNLQSQKRIEPTQDLSVECGSFIALLKQLYKISIGSEHCLQPLDICFHNYHYNTQTHTDRDLLCWCFFIEGAMRSLNVYIRNSKIFSSNS